MKLFTRYSRTNIMVIIAIFVLASLALYYSVQYVLRQQVDASLRIEEGEVNAYIQQHGRAPQSTTVHDQITEVRPVNGPVERRFSGVRFTEPGETKPEDFRRLTFGIHTGGQWYQVTVSKSLEDADRLTVSLLIVSSLTILAILVASFLINRILLGRLWRDFYRSLNVVREFKVGSGQPIELPSSKIDEFNFMNTSLERLTLQARTDYQVLKTFSENASHELQTPIAIIRSKLDLLIQDEKLSESQSQAAQSAYNAAQRLAQLNQSLLLLARIGNYQYEELAEIRVDELLREKLNDFQELWHTQQIRVRPELRPVTVRMNPELAHILLNNLLSNATRHNAAGGQIFLHLDGQTLDVCNTSPAPRLDDNVLFKRFYKGNQHAQHNGLGLSIIKQICDVSRFGIRYRHEVDRHCFRIAFAPEKD